MNSKKIIAAVAKKNGISYEECYAEMKEAILAGFHGDNPEATKAWDTVKFRGMEPTVEDVIRAVVQKVKGGKAPIH